MMIQHGEGELGELAMEELSVCREEIERLKASLMNAVIPQDEADRHSAVLELRPGRQPMKIKIICTLKFYF